MKDEKRLSVIIPGYNTSEECWRRCVASVRYACGDHDEIICVDDGSKEPVEESWVGANVDGRVRLVRKENGGLASARNLGLNLARGKYVTFVDSDDEVRAEVFGHCTDEIERTGVDIAVYGVEVVWTVEKLKKVDSLPDKIYNQLTPTDVAKLYEACLLNYACNKIYRHDFLLGNQRHNKHEKMFFEVEGMPCEDIIFNLKCVMNSARWMMVNYVGYIYYRCGTTLLSRYRETNYVGFRLCAKAWRDYLCTIDMIEHKKFTEQLFQSTDRFAQTQEWKNLWRPMSPFSLLDRWNWLRQHKELGGIVTYVKMAAYILIRRYLYVLPLRKWHIKHLFKNVVPA